ncbi:MAG TPA: hypothetical protein VGA16_03665 [Candidatus Limnocylindria bacterium]
MTRARLRFPHGEPLEFDLDQVESYGPAIGGFRAWLGAVFASTEGRWIVRLTDERVLGFARDELKRVRVTPQGISLVLGGDERAIDVDEGEVRSYGPEPTDVRSWLGRLAHGSGEAWVRLKDGSEMRFPIGGGPHVTFVG